MNEEKNIVSMNPNVKNVKGYDCWGIDVVQIREDELAAAVKSLEEFGVANHDNACDSLMWKLNDYFSSPAVNHVILPDNPKWIPPLVMYFHNYLNLTVSWIVDGELVTIEW
jgi:hypothetical protein